MKTRFLLTCVAVLACATNAWPRTDAYYFGGSDAWGTAAHWDSADCNGNGTHTVPTGNEVITICFGTTVTMTGDFSAAKVTVQYDAVLLTDTHTLTVGAGRLDIDPDNGGGTTFGKLKISGVDGEVVLNAGGTHAIDGQIYLEAAGAKLSVATATGHILSGAGAIVGSNATAVINLPEVNDTAPELESRIEIRGILLMTGAGEFLNAGKVIANVAGTLDMRITGTIDDTAGSERWKVMTDAAAKLLFQVEPASLCGDFVVSAGELLAGDDIGEDDIDVLTFGDLLHTGGKIIAGVNDSFTFGGTCP